MQIKLTNFTKSFGDITVIDKLNLTVNSGEMLALLGSSGCGKSTTLFTICGIHRMNGGTLHFGDRDVSNVPSQKRNVGVVFQNYALYPHMSIRENIAFPLKVQKQDNATILRKVDEIAELVHISELLDRKPAQLSGGQQQRVALSRALVRKPDVLLLDEPLANLDAKLRLEMRSEIRRIQLETGITAVLVTHDQVEAMSMCDRIALMKDGKILQLSEPDQMYNDPANKFVAGFLGNPPISFIDSTVGDGHFVFGENKIRISEALKVKVKNRVDLGLRPEFFGPQFGEGVRGKVSFVETQGREDLYNVTLTDGTVLRSIQPAGNRVQLGADVNWGVATENVMAFSEQGLRL
ncbi:ABC transporter ATP-binding protein [Granulosicoccus antarcticus]|uniref:Maltose/maltodextrin import ATP-binding protein MalK n=1 Tax=Granulosicoccus antarcticus IMCC3135 TaxID=1192854 RepID=A0A2Z2NSA7_9GAMM|nr:ABC transporter ATP-binding protein [Granulosicoccus antarcticus]ASJ73395.1 Maltose/maltodextrin import ATP-binding protein MalK [Granulosicoccus antarcticus IMCC3135]